MTYEEEDRFIFEKIKLMEEMAIEWGQKAKSCRPKKAHGLLIKASDGFERFHRGRNSKLIDASGRKEISETEAFNRSFQSLNPDFSGIGFEWILEPTEEFGKRTFWEKRERKTIECWSKWNGEREVAMAKERESKK